MWSRFFKKKNKEFFGIHHPDICNQIEPAFKVGFTQYYRFKDEYRIPAGRYKYVYAFIREVDLRMTLDTLKKLVEELKKCLNASKQQVDLEMAWRLLFNLESRISLAFEPETIKRLASVCYFDDTEDLSTFDKDYGATKIKHWEKHKCLDFFLTQPIGTLLGLNDSLVTSLAEYLETTTDLIKDLNQDLLNLSGGNSSESGKKTS